MEKERITPSHLLKHPDHIPFFYFRPFFSLKFHFFSVEIIVFILILFFKLLFFPFHIDLNLYINLFKNRSTFLFLKFYKHLLSYDLFFYYKFVRYHRFSLYNCIHKLGCAGNIIVLLLNECQIFKKTNLAFNPLGQLKVDPFTEIASHIKALNAID